ncbi:MAG: ketosteroid isomerase-related protein [Bacteriovoracia bacterium]
MNNETSLLIEKYYQAFNQKNYEGMLELLSEDVSHDINQGKRIPGKKAFREFLQRMDFLYDENLTDIVIMTDASGKRASAEFICNGTYKNTDEGLPPARGQTYKIPVGTFFDINGGKITRVTNYYNLNDWIKMVK